MEFKKVCVGCLSNKSLIEYVKQHSKNRIELCPICNSRNKIAIDIMELSYYIEDCIMKNYSHIDDMDGIDYDEDTNWYYYIDTERSVEFTNLNQIFYDNSVFSDTITKYSNEELCEAIFKSINSKIGIYDNLSEKGYTHFQSNDLFYTWERLNYLVQHNNRFFDNCHQHRYDCLDKIISEMENYKEEIPKGTLLYRVRKVNEYSNEIFSNPELALKEISPPPCKFTKSYRMSPKGISYTYLSTDITTCLKECSTKIRDKVLVGTFEAKEDLNILNLEIKKFPNYDLFSGKLNKEQDNINRFIDAYCRDISKPVESDNDYEYLSTQIIAEYIRFLGYDGIAYSSSKTKEKNYVFFYGPDYFKYPDLRPIGWNCYIDTVPFLTKVFDLKEYAVCEILNSRSCKYNIIKSTKDFNNCLRKI